MDGPVDISAVVLFDVSIFMFLGYEIGELCDFKVRPVKILRNLKHLSCLAINGILTENKLEQGS
jgi:hypothetical protein